MAATVTESKGVKVITEVVPQTDPRAAQLTSTEQQPSLAPVQGFKKAQFKALGAIQIVAGITQISFGIALTITESIAPPITVVSGVYFWIGFLVTACCIISGLVTVATLVAVIIHSVEIIQDIPWCSEIKDGKMTKHQCIKSDYDLCYGINSVFILLCLLELCTAITALVYSHKALKQQDYRQMVL